MFHVRIFSLKIVVSLTFNCLKKGLKQHALFRLKVYPKMLFARLNSFGGPRKTAATQKCAAGNGRNRLELYRLTLFWSPCQKNSVRQPRLSRVWASVKWNRHFIIKNSAHCLNLFLNRQSIFENFFKHTRGFKFEAEALLPSPAENTKIVWKYPFWYTSFG